MTEYFENVMRPKSNADRKNLRDWVEYYTKILSDDRYTNCYGQVVYLDDMARNYIRIQMTLVEEELKNER